MDKNTVENLKSSYLAAYQSLQFSKVNKTEAEIADIELRSLFIKYMICKIDTNEDCAGALLESELSNYTDIVDNPHGLNNYWKEFNALNINTDNNPLNWKSNLTNPNIALQFIDKLPCSSEKNLCCKNKQCTERDIQEIINLWKNVENSPRLRKIADQTSVATQQIKINETQIKNKSKVFNYQQKVISATKNDFESLTNTRQNSNLQRANTSKANIVFKNEIHCMDKKEEKSEEKSFSNFKTARTVLSIQQAKNNRQPSNNRQQLNNKQQPIKKSLGGRALNSPFVCPFKEEQPKEEEPTEPIDDRLKNVEPKMIELIKNEIMDCGKPISWDDIAGLDHAKRIIKEIIVYPMLRPDLFTGLRRPPKGILLFGPPGTGKTLIGKCIASQSKATFFSISASSLTSKWVGEGEKMVRALFAVAQVEQPSVIFIDEIDSLLCQRSETEHESSRRMKTEFLVQLDGAATGDDDRILVIGATNRPYELDEAARRRLVKRLYVPLPESKARAQIVWNLLKSEKHDLTDEDVLKISMLSDGYSGADMANLCKEASMGPIRSIPFDQLENIRKENLRHVTFEDFKEALDTIHPSVSQNDLSVYVEWDRTYGTASVHA